MTKNWKEYLKITGICLACILAGLQILSWFSAPSVSLNAIVGYAEIELPPNLKEEFERIHQLLKTESLEEMAGLPSSTPTPEEGEERKAIENTLAKLSRALRSKITGKLPDEISHLDGVYWISIENDSSTALSNVRMTVPNLAVVQFLSAGKAPVAHDNDNVIQLGTMQPLDSISLIAWTNWPPSKTRANDIRLTHDKGVGSVTIREYVGPVWQWLNEYGPILSLLVLFIWV